MLTDEITKEILRDNHIVVTETGGLISFKRGYGVPLKVRTNKRGYKEVNLSLWSFRANGKRLKSTTRKYKVHSLVCRYHHGPRPSPEHVVNHKDGKKWNNHRDNLEWVTQSQNAKHYHQLLKIGLDGTAENL